MIDERDPRVESFFGESARADWKPYQLCSPEQMGRIRRFKKRMDAAFGPSSQVLDPEALECIETLLKHHRGNMSEWEEQRMMEWQRLLEGGKTLSAKQKNIVDNVTNRCSRMIARRG